MTVVRRSGLPVPRTSDAQLQGFLDRTAEMLRVWNGEGRDPLDRVITARELTAAVSLANAGIGSGLAGVIGEIPGNFTPTQPVTPIAPTGVVASAAFRTVVVSWDPPGYNGHAYAEIWRAGVDDLGVAVSIGIAPGRVYSDSDVEGGQTYYYWVRFISITDIEGPYNATAGTPATTAPDVQFLLTELTDSITESQLYANLNNRIDLIDDPNTGLTQQYTIKLAANGGIAGYGLAITATDDVSDPSFSEFYVNVDRFAILPQTGTPGVDQVAPFIVDGGVVYMDEAMIRTAAIQSAQIFELAADKITVSSGTIADVLIGTADIDSAMIADASITTAKIAGAAIGTAQIANAAITTAKIGDAQVDTLKIKDDAVVVPVNMVGAQTITFSYPAGTHADGGTWSSWTTVNSLTFTLDVTAPTSILYKWTAHWASRVNCSTDYIDCAGQGTYKISQVKARLRLRIGSTVLASETGGFEINVGNQLVPTGSPVFSMETIELSPGTYTFAVEVSVAADENQDTTGGCTLPFTRPCAISADVDVDPSLIAFVVQR